MIEGKLEVKLPTMWTDEKQRWEEQAKRREEQSRSRKRKSQKKEDLGARKGRKVAKHCFLPMICGSGGSKSRIAKAAGAEPAGQMRDEQLHAVVARSTFPSQNVQNTPLLALEMLKKCTLMRREAHFEVKMYETPRLRSTFRSCAVEKTAVARSTFRSQNVHNTPGSDHFGSWDIEKVHAYVARSTFRSQNVKNTACSRHFSTLKCRFAWQGQGIVHLAKSEQNVRFCSISYQY